MTESMVHSSCKSMTSQLTAAEDMETPSRSNSASSGTSDNGAPERPVREKLRKATIAGLPDLDKMVEGTSASSTAGADSSADQVRAKGDDTTQDADSSPRGRPTRKRSFDDLQNESVPGHDAATNDDSATAGIYHKRMRSRDVPLDGKPTTNGGVDKEHVEALPEEENVVEAIAGARSTPEEPDLDVQVKQSPMIESTDAPIDLGENLKAEASMHKQVAESGLGGEDDLREGDLKAKESPVKNSIVVPPIPAPSPDENIAAEADCSSPKKKRSRDQLDNDAIGSIPLQEAANETTLEKDLPKAEHAVTQEAKNDGVGEPKKKKHRDTSQDGRDQAAKGKLASKDISPSGFTNTSILSPFGSLISESPQSKNETSNPESASNEKKQTSSSAFASSGLSAFAGSSKSPFGNLGSSNGPGLGSGFGSFATKETTGFGSASGLAGPSPFAAQANTGFGSLNGPGFGPALGSKIGGPTSGLSQLAPVSGSSGAIWSGSSSRPFGTPARKEDDDEDDDDDDDKNDEENEGKIGMAGEDANQKDSRFFEQQVETGEEEEDTIFTSRAKLFQYIEKEWKERGVGTVKLNVYFTTKEADPEQAGDQKARLVMRTDGVHRVVLNTPIFKGMKFGTPDGNEPTGKMLNFTGIEDKKPALLLLKLTESAQIGKEDAVKDLYHKILAIHEGL